MLDWHSCQISYPLEIKLLLLLLNIHGVSLNVDMISILPSLAQWILFFDIYPPPPTHSFFLLLRLLCWSLLGKKCSLGSLCSLIFEP